MSRSTQPAHKAVPANAGHLRAGQGSRCFCHSGDVQIGILGPLEVLTDGSAVPVTGSRLRAVVTRLALDAPAAVSTTALVDAVWPARAPADRSMRCSR